MLDGALPPLVSRHRFGSALAAARGALGLSAEELAASAPQRVAAAIGNPAGPATSGPTTSGFTAERLIGYELGEAQLTDGAVEAAVALYRIGPRRFDPELWIPVLDTSRTFPDDPYARLAVAVVADEPVHGPLELAVRYLAVRRLLRGVDGLSVGNQEQAVISECMRVSPARVNRELRELEEPAAHLRRVGGQLAGRLVVPHTGVLIGTGPGGTLLMRQRHRDNVAGPARGRRHPPVGPLADFSAG